MYFIFSDRFWFVNFSFLPNSQWLNKFAALAYHWLTVSSLIGYTCYSPMGYQFLFCPVDGGGRGEADCISAKWWDSPERVTQLTGAIEYTDCISAEG